MSAKSSKRPRLVRETLVVSKAATSSAPKTILVCDDSDVDEEAPTERMITVVRRKRDDPPTPNDAPPPETERPTIPSPIPISAEAPRSPPDEPPTPNDALPPETERPTIPSPIPISGAPRSLRPSSKRWFPLELAAPRMNLAPNAVRLRCQRAAVKNEDGSITANLGGGFRAVKMGGRWMIRFPD